MLNPLLSRPTHGSAGETGEWRVYRPVVNAALCSKCWECVLYCPEGVIFEGANSAEINYRFCKGCGICKEICKQKAIDMVQE